MANKKIKIKGKNYDVDEDGFLLNAKDKTKDWHDHAMAEEGLPVLTSDHTKVMDAVLLHNDIRGELPTAAELSRTTGMKIRYMHELFPTGPGRATCKIAGVTPTAGLVNGRLPRNNKDRKISKARGATQRELPEHGGGGHVVD